MRKIIISFSLLIFVSGFSQVRADESALTLQKAYQLALKRSEKIARLKEIIKEAQARFTQALSQIFPRLSYSYSYEWQNGQNTSNFTLREIPEGKFTFTQPIFTGFKSFALISAGRAEKRQRTYEEEYARELLFIDVYDAFYFLLGYEEDLASLQKTKTVLEERIAELKKSEELGRSRTSEVVNAEVQLNRSEAEIERIINEREIAKQLLEFLTGETVTAITDETDPGLADLSFLENYLAAGEKRPDVLRSKAAYESLQNQVTDA